MPPFSCCPFITVCCLHLCDFYGADSFVPLCRGEEQMKKCSFTSKGHIPGTFFLFRTLPLSFQIQLSILPITSVSSMFSFPSFLSA